MESKVIQTGHFEQVIFKGKMKDVSTQMSIIAKYRAVKKTAFQPATLFPPRPMMTLTLFLPLPELLSM